MKLVFGGCSYLAHNSQSLIEYVNQCGYKGWNTARAGNSNEGILFDLHQYINPPKDWERIKNSIIVCQLTHTHRRGMYHDCFNAWINYQPNSINWNDKINFDIINLNNIKQYPHIENLYKDFSAKGVSIEDFIRLNKMHQTYLELVYNSDAEFEFLMYQLKLFKSWVETLQNQIIFVYWPVIENEIQKEKIIEQNFFNIEGEYSIQEWATKNGMTDGSFHLTKNGMTEFGKKIIEWIERGAGGNKPVV